MKKEVISLELLILGSVIFIRNDSYLLSMEISFDKVANVLYLQFSHENVKDTEEINDGIIIDYGANDNVIGIEILNYTERNLNLNEIIHLNADEIIPVIVQWQ